MLRVWIIRHGGMIPSSVVPVPELFARLGTVTMGDHHFETLQEFETGDFLLQFKSCLHGIFYLDKHTICKQQYQVFIWKTGMMRTEDFLQWFSLPLMA